MSGWKRLGAVALALLGCSALAGQPLLRNASFETPKEQRNWFSDQPAHWERWGDWINRETSWSPTREGECLIGYHNWKIQGEGTSGLYQDIPDAERGKQYTFSIYGFKDVGTNVDTIELRLEPSGGGEAVGSRVYRVGSLKSRKWNRLSVTGRPLTDGIRVMVIVTPKRTAKRKGALKFDEASFRGPRGGSSVAASNGP